MSKTKLTYITPVLDFVHAESEGILDDTLRVSAEHTKPGDQDGEDAKDSHFQFDDSDADFFYLD